jgi:exopolyphosphatase/guanosine-5'-triphosphate,3'-diphosphate pyrophosphatase
LIEGATQIAHEEGFHATMEPVLSRWMEPLFPQETPAERRLRIAACLLGDVARTEHPDHRAEHGSLKMLRLPLVGLDHADRAFLAGRRPSARAACRCIRCACCWAAAR